MTEDDRGEGGGGSIPSEKGKTSDKSEPHPVDRLRLLASSI